MDSLVDHLGRPFERRPIEMPVNNQWYYWLRNQVDAFYRPDNISIDTYEKMLLTDETVFSSTEFLTMSVLARLGDYNHPDSEIQEFVRRNLTEMEGSFPAAVGEILTALPFGFSITEHLYSLGRSDSRIWLGGLQTLHPSTITFDLWRDGPRKNKLKTIHQFWRLTNQVDIPVRKAIVYAHNGRYGNVYGWSRLRGAYAPWFIKQTILKAWGLCCERYGAPYTIARTDATGNITVGGVVKGVIDYLGEVLDSLASSGSLVVDKNTEVEIAYAPRGFGADFEGLVSYCNKMINRALGLPSLISDHGNTGSYSLGQQHWKLFTLVLEKILYELIEVLIEQLIRPLIEMNFGPQVDGYGDFAVESFEEEDQKMLAELHEILARAGVIDLSNLDDLNQAREAHGFPPREQEDIEPSLPTDMPRTEEIEPEVVERAPEEQFTFSWASMRRRRRSARAEQWRSLMREARIGPDPLACPA